MNLNDAVNKLTADAAAKRDELDVGDHAATLRWLRDYVGSGKLAGIFARGSDIVYTPHEGEDGYRPLTDAEGDDDGPAQVRAAPPLLVADLIDQHFDVITVRKNKQGELVKTPTLFPKPVADRACSRVDDRPNLRPLRGVVHSPVFRADGSLIEAPGYDDATGLLHQPEPGLVVEPVADTPSPSDLRRAVGLILHMVADFPFVSDHDRVNYLGLLLTPLLRSIVGPPYKLGAIEAHQRGSGKTLLANTIRVIHGGVFRGEMPEDDAELRKQISTILLVTTGPVVVIDNVSGRLNSSTLASLLTASRWDDRKLGTMNEMVSRPNDRLWLVTANNLEIGGDLPRRTLRVTIDPKTPQSELRTHFAIDDLETWIRQRRGELLWALLTIVRSWIVAGRPLGTKRTSDGYSTWVRTIAGILGHVGIEGDFDHGDTQVLLGADDEEWSAFLKAIHREYAGNPWTCKELLESIDRWPDLDTWKKAKSNGKPRLVPDDMPTEFTKVDMSGHQAVTITARSLGRWLANRRGRWAGDYTVREAGESQKIKKWRVEHVE